MRRALTISLLLGAASVLLAQDDGELIIRSAGPSTTVVEYAPRFTRESVRGSSAQEYVRFQFRGELHGDGPPGTPIVPYRSVTLDLPSDQVSLRVLSAEFEVVQNVRALPHPRRVADGKFGATLIFEDAAGPPPEPPASPLVATLDDVAPRRDGFAGTLRLFPVAPNGSAQTVRLYTKIVVEIRSSPARSVAPLRSLRAAPSPLAQGSWYKVEIQETGIYAISRQYLSSAGVPSALLNDMRSVRILGSGGGALPEDLSSARPNTLEEIPRHVVDRDGDNVFDAEDLVLFYGRSPRAWRYDPPARTSRHTINPYAERTVYFLTVGGTAGRGMDSVASLEVPGAYRASSSEGRVFLEEERVNLISSGRQWFGQSFDADAPSAVFTNQLPGLVPGSSIEYRFVVLSRSSSVQSFRFEENGQFLGRIFLSPVVVNSIEGPYASQSPVSAFTFAGPVADARSVLRITYEATSSTARGWLDWFEILYRRALTAAGDELQMSSLDTAAVVEYELGGFSSRQIEVFDVTDHGNVLRISNLAFNPVDPSRVTFQLAGTAGSRREIIALTPSAYRVPPAMTAIPNSDLRGIQSGAEYVIIAPAEFVGEAERLRAHRAQKEGLSGIVVSFEHLANEFGGGIADPTAIRDFLLFARAQWQVAPRFVLLFGDGHYDYKGIASSERNWIVPYESSESIVQILSYASDDFFVTLDAGNPRVSISLGRIPVGSAQAAAAVVDKILSYDDNRSFDSWKTRVTYVADDGLTSTGDDGTIHTAQADVLAQTYTPPLIDKRKIYIVGYPTVSSASGRRKPDANKAIIDALNRGTLMINYTGHGNPEVWAHEWVFTREESLSKLTNADRLTFLVAATCDFARYDNPMEESAGEEIFVMEGGGSVGVMTSSRAVYSFQNAQFNNTFYSEVFKRDSSGRYSRLGDAMWRTKQVLYGTNDIKYHLFADPAMRLAIPPQIARVDSINGSALTSVVDVPTLGTMVVEGRITAPDGSHRTDFNGRALLEVYDAKQRIFVPEWGTFSYEVNGSILHRGEVSVSGGRFRGISPIPKDVSYGENAARVAIYAWDQAGDATGYTESLRISGTDTTAAVDTSGPQIDIFFNDEAFRPGDVTAPGSTLLVNLADQSGINTSTAGIGHRLEARFSALAQSVDLSEYYRSNLDTYQSGRIAFTVPELPEGRQSVAVKAWDTRNNSNEQEVFFEVRASSELEMYNVMNFPNPFSRSTRFTFQRSATDPIEVEIRVYTVAGRLIQVLGVPSTIDRFVEVEWDGRDRDGGELANGVYFYKLITRPVGGGEAREFLGKLAVLR